MLVIQVGVQGAAPVVLVLLAGLTMQVPTGVFAFQGEAQPEASGLHIFLNQHDW